MHARRLSLLAVFTCAALAATPLAASAATSAFRATTSTRHASTVSSTPSNRWGTNGRVSVIRATKNRIYIGGTFSAVMDPSGAVHSAHNLAVYIPRLGRFQRTWHTAVSGPVDAIAISKGSLYIGGHFSKVAGRPRVDLAKLHPLSGRVYPAWKPRVNDTVRAMVVNHGRLYVGGDFTRLRDLHGEHNAPYLARVGLLRGVFDRGWTPRPNASVRTLAISPRGAHLYVGGDFDAVNGHSRAAYIAALNTTTGHLMRGFAAAPTNRTLKVPALSLRLDGRHLVAGVAGPDGALTSLSPRTGARQWMRLTNGDVQAVTVMNGVVYAGGHFNGAHAFAGQPRYKLAAASEVGGHVLNFAPRVNSALGVWSLAGQSGRLYSGGDFTKVNFQDQHHLAVFR